MGNHRRMIRLCLAGALLFGSFTGTTALAESNLFIAKDDWKRLELPNQPPAEFAFSPSGDLTVRTDKSVAFLYRAIADSAGSKNFNLSWRWRVDHGFLPTDLGIKGKDDRPLAVHLWFADDRANSIFGPLGWVFGYPHISHTVTYVLGGNHPPGSVVANPYYDNGVIICLRGRQMTPGRWYSEKRDIETDVARAFPGHSMMKRLKYISVSADTDDTGGSSVARIAALTLMKAGRP